MYHGYGGDCAELPNKIWSAEDLSELFGELEKSIAIHEEMLKAERGK